MSDDTPAPEELKQAETLAADLRETARTAWSFGLAAMGLAMVAPCGSYITLLAALPLGLVAMARARTVLESGTIDPTTEIYARTGKITGLAAAIWSGMVLVLVALFVLLYGALFAAIIAGS